MKSKVVKLTFETPVHFGKKRLSDSEMSIKADTLFSAMFIEAIQLGLDTNILLNEIILSDTFPYIQDELYLPKPLLKITPVQKDDNYKVFKKLKYIPVDQYADYLDGKISSDEASIIIDEFNIGSSNTETKVSLINIENNGDAEPFSIGTFTFVKNAGLYFIINYDEQYDEYIHTLLNSLQYSGLGGKRTSGYGRFKYEIIENHEINNLQVANRNILLSTSMMKSDEQDLISKEDRYTLSKRTGFIQSPNFENTLVKKRDFYAFNAGSVFKNKFKGEIVDVGDNGNHPVYRYAKACWLGV